MRNKSSRAIALLHRYWLPILCGLILILVCTDSNHEDGRALARLFSGTIYRYYIATTLVLLLAMAWRLRSPARLRHVVELILFTLVTTNVLKYATGLPRPPHMKNGVPVLGGALSPGFPSAHTAFAVGLAWLVWEYCPRLAIPWFAVAVAVGWSRVEIDAHYPYQVWAGALLGVLLARWIANSKKGALAALFPRRRSQTSQSSSLRHLGSAFLPLLSDLWSDLTIA